ncbi:amidase [Halomonas sp. EGI 63088]|uniref:Amidase n=1 Tax=Halomonas flagellata TaxID=2920385 RepID=A0ABS9RWW1_9GAMM|nr:amidase [Halomonas flagellata]
MTPPTWRTATDGLTAIRTGDLTSEALMRECLQRVAAREPDVAAWQYLDERRALEEARRRDSSASQGPLHGMPVAVKDLFSTHDMPTGCGSAIYADHRPASDAAVVALLRRAGGIVMGKTVTTEFAFYSPGGTRNPHDLERTPGGSSSGSAAAVADGMVPWALGTQTAGSIIRPASYCGVVGYKPTYGLINTAGLKPAAWSLDTVGVFARNVPDVGRLAGVLSGRDLAPSWPATHLPRVGLCLTPQWEAATADTEQALQEAVMCIRDAGGEVHNVRLPASFDELLAAQHTIMIYEACRSLAFERDRHGDQLSSQLKALLDEGSGVPAVRYDQARQTARGCRAELGRVFMDIDVLLAPSAPGEAPAHAAGTGDPVFSRIWTLLGTPCVNVPGLTGASGMPVGVQLIGPRDGDLATLSIAEWLFSRLNGG